MLSNLCSRRLPRWSSCSLILGRWQATKLKGLFSDWNLIHPITIRSWNCALNSVSKAEGNFETLCTKILKFVDFSLLAKVWDPFNTWNLISCPLPSARIQLAKNKWIVFFVFCFFCIVHSFEQEDFLEKSHSIWFCLIKKRFFLNLVCVFGSNNHQILKNYILNVADTWLQKEVRWQYEVYAFQNRFQKEGTSFDNLTSLKRGAQKKKKKSLGSGYYTWSCSCKCTDVVPVPGKDSPAADVVSLNFPHEVNG